MASRTNSQETEALTDLLLTMFRTNDLALTWGDRLVSPLGLTSARWQILGAIVQVDRPQPVAWLARDLGATRQNVQRIVNDLVMDGIVTYEPNPHHKRAHLVVVTAKGQKTYEDALALYDPLVEALAEGLAPEDIGAAQRVMSALRTRLEQFNGEG